MLNYVRLKGDRLTFKIDATFKGAKAGGQKVGKIKIALIFPVFVAWETWPN